MRMMSGSADDSSGSAEKQQGNELDVHLPRNILRILQANLSRNEFLISALPSILESVGSVAGGLVSQRGGGWARECWVGDDANVPPELVGEALDRGSSARLNGWFATPLNDQPFLADGEKTGSCNSALIFRIDPRKSIEDTVGTTQRIQSATDMLSAALHRVDAHQRNARRVEQLTAVLHAAAQWQQLDDDESLLKKIAATATELLQCERASIFLWDRRRKKLIGKPSLGVEGKSLEVDDDAGIVGEVLRSGEPKIWNASHKDDERRINRSVDQTLAFETHSLVAVPMFRMAQRGAESVDSSSEWKREPIGVFEAINHREKSFESLDMAVLADLALHAAVAIESQRTRKSLTASRDRLVNDAASETQLIGNHASIESVRKNANKLAPTDLSVMILGSNGTGKEVLARHIHYQSNRRNGPFVAVNCAALVETLLESELFGHEKGSFTDASQTRIGKFELANGGTLFLDEVGDMSPGGQAKLLRVLEDKVVVRVGGVQTIPVDVRVIAATNQPLEQRIFEKRFREDLFFRLNVVSLTLPDLAHRGDDIVTLAEHFLTHFSYKIGRQVPTFSPQARSALLAHPWRGNVRELRNTMERVCYLSSENEIDVSDLMLTGTSLTSTPSSGAKREHEFLCNAPWELTGATRVYQVAHIERAIDSCGGNMTEAAQRLGLHRSNLYRKMRQLGMPTSGESDSDR